MQRMLRAVESSTLDFIGLNCAVIGRMRLVNHWLIDRTDGLGILKSYLSASC